jgi:DNA-directed RNA polymerase specialized sigma24 family protein
MSTAQSQAALPAELEAIASARTTSSTRRLDRIYPPRRRRSDTWPRRQAPRSPTPNARAELRARRELSGDVLRQLARAAKRKREADREYEQAIARAGRLGLSHREIAAAAEVSHGTVRAILTRATASLNGNEPQAAEEESTASDDIAQ